MEEEIGMETSLEESLEDCEKRDLGAREEAGVEGGMGASMEASQKTDLGERET